MNIAVVGLGYVGAVTSTCFAHAGHRVAGVDLSEFKVKQMNSAIPPVAEAGLAEMLATAVDAGLLVATSNLADVWADLEVVIVSVGTPSGLSGDVDLGAIRAVSREIGELLSDTPDYKVVVITSTIPPGTLKDVIKPTLEEISGKTSGIDFGLCFSPEFLREGTAIRDFMEPEKVVIGADDERSAARLRELFGSFSNEPAVTSTQTAEAVKFAANGWHALKVAFANEMGRVCQDAGIDSHEVMRIFKEDRKLNISDRYLTPGFAFGGSCLPKDLRTLTYRARSRGVRVPVLESILASNEEHLAFALRTVESLAPRKVLVLGLAFKAGTDDLRESPSVPLVEALLGRGYEVRIFDEHIQVDQVVGPNREYLHTRLPHLVHLLTDDPTKAAVDADLVVIAQSNELFARVVSDLNNEQQVLDLTGIGRGVTSKARYSGLTW